MQELEKIVSEIEAKAKSTAKPEQGDYIVDGLLYCHKCNTPKQCRVVMFKQEMTPYCLCKCESERLEKEKIEKERRAFANRVERLRAEGMVRESMRSWTFDNDDGQDQKLTNMAKNYVEHWGEFKPRGKGLLLYGATGSGKTYAVCEIANALIDQGVKCCVTSFAEILPALTSGWSGAEYLENLQSNDLIVFDDFGVERQTEFAKEQIFNIIDARCKSGRPFLITTNMGIDDFKNPKSTDDRRIFHRILEKCFPYEVNCANRRFKNIRDDFADTKRMLGIE